MSRVLRGRAFVRWSVRKLRKAVIGPPSQSWSVGAYRFEFRKGGRLGVLTATGPELAMPYHVVCRDLLDARQKARQLHASLSKGHVPERGVYRSLEVGPARYRAPQGGQSLWR